MRSCLPDFFRPLRAVALVAGLTLVAGCLEFEQEIVLEPDGSGRTVVRYAAQASLIEAIPTFNGLLLDRRKIERHFGEKPGLRLDGVDVVDRGKIRYVRMHLAFDDVSALSDEALSYSWKVEGTHRAFRIDMHKRQYRHPEAKMQSAVVQALQDNGFRFKVRLPSRIVETNADKVEWASAEWFVPLGYFVDRKAPIKHLYAKVETDTWDAVKGWFSNLFGP